MINNHKDNNYLATMLIFAPLRNIILLAMSKELKRFVWRDKEMKGLCREASVIVDSETGVNYLFVVYGNGAGLTPLIDEYGKPIVTRVIVDD